MGRWDYLFDAKAVPLVEQLLDEVAKTLAKDLAGWPPPVEDWSTEADRLRFAPLFEPAATRPSACVFREAFRLARWEMGREVAAIDEYMRAERWRERGVAPGERLALLFLHQWLVEQMLGLSEATLGRVKRPLLAECLVRIERRLAEVLAVRQGGSDGAS